MPSRVFLFHRNTVFQFEEQADLIANNFSDSRYVLDARVYRNTNFNYFEKIITSQH